jgi:hypothetical protein
VNTTTQRDATRNDRAEVLAYLLNCGLVISFTIGTTFNGVVDRDYLVVRDAPPAAVRDIITKFVMVGLNGKGLLIPLTPLTSAH